MTRECYLCHKTYDLFILQHTFGDEQDNEEVHAYLCGKCWNVIAAVAVKTLEVRFEMLEAVNKTLEKSRP